MNFQSKNLYAEDEEIKVSDELDDIYGNPAHKRTKRKRETKAQTIQELLKLNRKTLYDIVTGDKNASKK